MDNDLKRSLKGYELRERVGAGGFGVVYRAYQAAIDRDVAIKIILPERANQPEFIRRFEVEAQLAARLEHPHIVPLYDYWRDPDGAYLVMRWLPNTLRTSLTRGAWSVDATARLLEQIAGALTVAHREGVIHRDIKPDNLLLDEDENAYLADFGIAKDINLGSSTEAGILLGSPAYITPEQIQGEPVTAHTDIYSLGLVIYEMLVNEKPYADVTSPAELISRHLHTPLPSVAARKTNLPAALDGVLQTATAKDPAQRYASALRFASAFRAALPASVSRVAPQPLAEPLTARELEVLRLVLDDLSNEQIAEKLFLSLTTIRWYMRQIYAKLDVHSRHDAMEQARRLRLFEPKVSVASSEIELHTVVGQRQEDAEPVNPYKGLRAFQEGDAPDFFGRAVLVERLLNRLAERADGARLLAVIGPSGSGKSSLVKAGLIPALRQGALAASPCPFIAEMLPGTHPLEELEAALLRVSVSPLPGLLDQLREDRRGLVRAAKRVLPSDPDPELVLVIDQFEELFTLVTDETMRAHFIDNLLAAVTDPRGRVRVVLTLRADFYDRPLLYPRLGEVVRTNTEVVLPLTARELEQAIQGPAERVGVQFEAGLVATLVNAVGDQPGALPLLEYALTELFERREGLTLTLGAYMASGGVLGALASRADELYETLDETSQTAARQLFLRLVTLGEGVEDTRRRVLRSELASLMESNRALDDVIDLYSQYRLLTFDRDPLTRGPTVEIAHEALIREWGRLRDWLNENRDALQVQRRLMASTEEWLASGKEPSFLANGARLLQFEALAQDGDLLINDAERAYLTTSVGAREQQEQAERQRQARELELAQRAVKSQQQSANRLRSLVGFLALFLVVSAGLSLFALNSRSDALNNFTRSEAQRLAAVSNTLRLQHLSSEVAALLAIRSMQLQYTTQGDEALANAATLDLPVQVFTGNTDMSLMVKFSPDGRYLVNTSNDGTARLWNAQTGQQIRQFPTGGFWSGVAISPDGNSLALSGQSAAGAISVSVWDVNTGVKLRQFVGHTGEVDGVVFSPDGRYLLTGSLDTTARLWDVQTGQELQRYVGHTDNIGRALAFFPDGQHVITGSNDRTVRVWDTFTGQEVRRLTVDNPVLYLALSPDAQSVLIGGAGGSLQLWDLQTDKMIRDFVGHTIQVNALGFFPDGRTLFSAGNDYTVRLWDVATGDEVRRLVGHNKPVFGAALSPDGHYLASSSMDDTLRLWSVGQPNGLPQFSSPGNGYNFSVAVSPDGRSVLTGGTDRIARLWDAQTGQMLRQFVGHGDTLMWVTFSPDGHYALTGGQQDNTARLWDVQSGQEVRRLDQSTSAVRTVFSPDGKRILTTSFSDNVIHLWDAQTGKELLIFSQHTELVNDVAFSPDSRFVVSTSNDETARLWSAETGQLVRQFNLPTATYAVAFARDGKTVFIGDVVGVTHQFDLQTGQELKQFVGHTDGVNNLAVSPDGRYLLSGGDTTARLWDILSGQEVRRFIGHTTQVSSVAFFSDGKHILTGEVSGIARVWDVDYHDTIRNLCARLQRDFTDDERAEFNITDHDPTCPPDLQTLSIVAPTWTPNPTQPIPVWTPLPLTPLPTDVPAATAQS